MEENTTVVFQAKKSKAPWVITVLLLIIIALAAVLFWCWRRDSGGGHSTTPPAETGGTAADGPCAEGADNAAPDGYTFYENTALGYRFAYPTAWGTVAVTTTPISGTETGEYVMGRFSANDKVWFGGNATDYVVRGRDGLPTDLPGYLKASDKFYQVELWRYNDGTTIEDRRDLHLIEPPHEEKAACNTEALITHMEASELSATGPADIAHFTLQPSSRYYGMNFVLDKPDEAAREQLNKLVESFELILP